MRFSIWPVFLVAVLSVGCGGDQTSGPELPPGGSTKPPQSPIFDEQIQPGDAREPEAVAPTTVTTARVQPRIVTTAPPVSTAPPSPPPATAPPEPVVAAVTTTSTSVTSTPTTATTSPTTTTSSPAVAGDEPSEPDEDRRSTTTTTDNPLHPGELQGT